MVTPSPLGFAHQSEAGLSLRARLMPICARGFFGIKWTPRSTIRETCPQDYKVRQPRIGQIGICSNTHPLSSPRSLSSVRYISGPPPREAMSKAGIALPSSSGLRCLARGAAWTKENNRTMAHRKPRTVLLDAEIRIAADQSCKLC